MDQLGDRHVRFQYFNAVTNLNLRRLIGDLQVKRELNFLNHYFLIFLVMKRIVLTTALILIISLASFASQVLFQGNSNSQFGAYIIVALDDRMPFKDRELAQYQITYENGQTVVVAVDKLEKCKKYYVLSEKLPIQYECNGVYFGVKMLDNNLLYNGFPISLDSVNKTEYYSQRVLARGVNGTLDHLNLIAAYYPGLYKV